MLSCPISGCNKEYKRLAHLKRHFKTHSLECCPICGASTSLVHHAYQMFVNYGCEGHAILWILLTSKTKCSMKDKLTFEEAREVTLRRLSEGFRFSDYVSPIPKPKKTKENGKKYKTWSYEEVKILLENYNKLTIKEIAKILGRSEEAVMSKLHRLNVGRRGLKPKYIRI